MTVKPIELTVLEKYVIHIKYSDGTEGDVDLSHLAHQGIFEEWECNNLFENAYIDEETDAIAWNKDIELCPDALYLKILNLPFEERNKKEPAYATN